MHESGDVVRHSEPFVTRHIGKFFKFVSLAKAINTGLHSDAAGWQSDVVVLNFIKLFR